MQQHNAHAGCADLKQVLEEHLQPHWVEGAGLGAVTPISMQVGCPCILPADWLLPPQQQQRWLLQRLLQQQNLLMSGATVAGIAGRAAAGHVAGAAAAAGPGAAAAACAAAPAGAAAGCCAGAAAGAWGLVTDAAGLVCQHSTWHSWQVGVLQSQQRSLQQARGQHAQPLTQLLLPVTPLLGWWLRHCLRCCQRPSHQTMGA